MVVGWGDKVSNGQLQLSQLLQPIDRGQKMHRSDRLGLKIILGGCLLIGGSYILFRVSGDSYLLAIPAGLGLILILGLIAKYFSEYNEND
jgi:hypothetical protein